jgi:hypothetical protein
MGDCDSFKVQYSPRIFALPKDMYGNLPVIFPLRVFWIKDGKINKITGPLVTPQGSDILVKERILSLLCHVVQETYPQLGQGRAHSEILVISHIYLSLKLKSCSQDRPPHGFHWCSLTYCIQVR